MHIKKTLHVWRKKINKIPKPHLIIAGVVLFLVSLYVVLFRERTIEYSYGGETCQQQLVFLPRLFRASGSDDYTITTSGGVDLWGYPIVSTSLCIVANKVPSNDAKPAAISFLGGWLARIAYKVDVPETPKASFEVFEAPIAATKPIIVELNKPDETFSYSIRTDTISAECSPENLHLSCDIPALQLQQGGEYVVSVTRRFKNEEPETLTTMSVKTLSPVSIVASSIAQEATVYDRPTTIVLETDKSLKTTIFELTKIEGETITVIPIETVFDNKTVTVTFSEQLARSSQFALSAKTFEATDDSTLLDPYVLRFQTSGGPKVTGVSAGSTGVPMGATVVVTFDQALYDKQDISKIVTVTGGASVIGRQGKQLLISTAGVPRCGTFTISITKDIQSNYEVSGDSAWKYTGRTICYTISTIGYSVNGRAINAYYFGSGSTTILYTGAIHGNEQSGRYITQQWIDELDAKVHDIPADRRIVVVPAVNPDGIARSGRNNANNVNLNRNFPTFNWTTDTPVAGGNVEKGAGGPSPLSEPESKALASFTLNLQPRFVVTYHSKGSLVNSNDVSISINMGQEYARLARYGYISNAATNETFGFTMTGTYEDWLIEQGIPAILIELNTDTGYHFTQNRSAMWAMLR